MVDEDEAPPAGLEGEAPLLGLDGEAPLLGLEGEAPLLELELAPPEAEPDFEASLEGDPLEDELDELGELGLALGLDEAPPEGDEDEAPPDGDEDELELDGDEGEVDGEVDDELDPDVPEEVLLLSPRSHAARPKASATATAKIESFMCPPWLGYEKRAAKCAPGVSP